MAQLADRSYAQVRAVLHRLVADGLVVAERHGQAVSYTLNREHVAAGALEQLDGACEAVEERVRAFVADWSVPARSVAVFGSFARRDGAADSDVDVLLVRPDGAGFDEPGWAGQRHALAAAVQRWTGNAAQVVDLDAGELAAAVRAGDALVGRLRAEVRTLAGEDVAALLAANPVATWSRSARRAPGQPCPDPAVAGLDVTVTGEAPRRRRSTPTPGRGRP